MSWQSFEVMAGTNVIAAPERFVWGDKDPQQLLHNWTKYEKNFKVFLRANNLNGRDDESRIALLMSVGGEDVYDLVERIGRVQLEEVLEIPEVVQGMGVAARPRVPGMLADTFQQALDKISAGIVALTNPLMERMKLFCQMPQEDLGFDVWAKELVKQGRRINWTGYDWETAVLDAIIFQTTDTKLRAKSLAQKFTLTQALEWGRTAEIAGRQVEKIDRTFKRDEQEDINRVD